jgi:hypothetical protein
VFLNWLSLGCYQVNIRTSVLELGFWDCDMKHEIDMWYIYRICCNVSNGYELFISAQIAQF